MLILIKLATWLLSPLGITSGLLLAAIAVKRVRFLMLSLGFLALWGLSSHWISQGILLKGLEDRARQLNATINEGAETKPSAIVVLGGGLLAASPPERPYPDLLPGADRVWHAARLFRERRAEKVVLTGGQRVGLEGSGLPSEAESMKIFLMDLGVPASAILIEDQARTTRENAAKTRDLIRAMLKPKEVERPTIILVTSASHMPRAFRNYAKAGFITIAEPAEYNAVDSTLATWEKLLPSESNLATSSNAIKEWIALAVDY